MASNNTRHLTLVPGYGERNQNRWSPWIQYKTLDTCTRLWRKESEQVVPVDTIKDVVRSSVLVLEFDKHLKKAEGHIGRNVVENNNKDEENSPKTLNDFNPLANQLLCIDFLNPPTALIIPHRLPTFLEFLMPLKNWRSIYARCPKSSLKHSICFCGIFSKIFLHIVLLKCQIAFLKFISCDNQALVGCIPIAAVAVHLKLKS